MNLKNNKILLIFCSFIPVGLDEYVNYFINNFNDFIYLKWKFPHIQGSINSSVSYYKNKKRIKEKILFSLPKFSNKFLYFLFLPLNYLIYLTQSLTLLLSRQTKKKVVFMGVNYYCAFCGIILKKLGKVDFVIYRVMDFFPLPAKGIYKYLNRIFYFLDNYCLKNADFLWFTTIRHIIGRENYGYFDRTKYQYILTPLGINIDKFISIPAGKTNQHSLVYCGVLSKYHLLDLVFDAVKILKKDFKKIKLNIIGSGPDENYFKNLAKKMKIEENVRFHGFLKEGKKLNQLMADNLLGIALYRDEEDFIKYTEPAKVKYYLSFGIPALISKVPLIAEELAEKKVSFAILNNQDEIIKTIKNFALNHSLQKEYKENIKNFVKSADVKKILNEVFKQILNEVFYVKR